jgi:two-component system LytT family response regulator
MVKAILVDDEPKANKLLALQLAESCPEIEITASTNNSIEAIELIRTQNPDLVFLDIEMPNLNGFELLGKMPEVRFEIIFITAFNQYAIEAFDHYALGYLLKPVQAQKLKEVVDMAIVRIREKNFSGNLRAYFEQKPARNAADDRIALPTLGGMKFVPIDEIIFCEADSNYTHFHLINNKQITVSRTLNEYEKLLPGTGFYRIHHKYILNLNFAREYYKGKNAYVILENGREIPISSSHKAGFLLFFEKWMRR